MYNCIQKQIKFPLLLLLLLTQEVYYYENKFMFAEILKYCLFFAEDNSSGKTMVEEKICRGSSLKYHQSIAALLMFSKIQRSRHQSESDAFPMLVVCPTDVVILIYQPETDTLVITQVLPWERGAYFCVGSSASQYISYQNASIKGMWIQKSYCKSFIRWLLVLR